MGQQPPLATNNFSKFSRMPAANNKTMWFLIILVKFHILYFNFQRNEVPVSE